VPSAAVTLFLGGDVMLGRGVDQILPHPGDPRLWERWITDARTYVELAESASGPIPWPVDFAWPWGDALALLDQLAPDVRLVNLETSVTAGGAAALGKGVHYRMSPGNVPALTAVDPDVCSIANNHVLDFGVDGLKETLAALHTQGIRLGVVTNGAVQRQQPKIEVLQIRPYLSTIVISEAMQVKKPDPRIFARALAEVGCSASQTWFVGDHPVNDVLGAAAVGLRPIWLTGVHPWPTEHPEPPWQIGALIELVAMVQCPKSLSVERTRHRGEPRLISLDTGQHPEY